MEALEEDVVLTVSFFLFIFACWMEYFDDLTCFAVFRCGLVLTGLAILSFFYLCLPTTVTCKNVTIFERN